MIRVPAGTKARVWAAACATEILRRKSGKFAEREADVYDVIHLAEWILGDDEAEPGSVVVPVNIDAEKFRAALQEAGERIRASFGGML